MDLPPPSPPSPSLSAAVVSAPAPAAVTADDFSSAALWDWGNLMDFSIGADDSLILSWDSPDLYQPPSPNPPLAEVASSVDPTSVAPPTAAGSSSRVRKRDPMLVCANYLAGRVPCACPEVDEKEREGDEEGELVLGGRKRVRAGVVSVGVRCQVPGCEADIRELKGYHRRHRVCLLCANSSSVMLDGEAMRYCQQCGKFHVLLDFDEGKRSCRRKLERHNKRRRRKPSDSKSVVETEKVSHTEPPEDVFLDTFQTQETLNGSAYMAVDNDVSNKIKDVEMLLDCENGHGSSVCSLPDLELAQSNSLTYTASADVSVDGRIDNPKSAISSTTCDNKSFYSSMCPTGRISFKLYDWNPAEFPRRLRHQIFQWLASMPVELEGYIRPGCTILTVFIAMPQYMWEKLSQEGVLYIKQLISAPESLLLGRGDIFIYLSNMVVHVLKDGTSLVNIKMEVKVPRLHYVHPTYFEAGKAVEFIACGSNLDQHKLRFLVSFAGNYLVCDAYRVTSHGKVKCYDEIAAVSGNNDAHEMYRINIIPTHPEVFGPAFIEVENESGISNFIPILIGDKQVCSELESIHCPSTRYSSRPGDIGVPNVIFENTACEANVKKQIDISDLLLDIAWVLKKPRRDYNDTLAGSLNVQRLKYMLQFSIQNELAGVLKAILKYMGNVIDQADFQKSENLTADADIEQLLEYMKTAGGFLNLRFQHEERSKLYPGHSNHRETVTVNHAENVIILKCPTNLVEERRKAYSLVSTSAVFSEDSDEQAHLLNKDISCSKNSFLRLGSYWTCKYWATNLFSPRVTRTWPAIFVMTTIIMCFVVCIILLNPNKVSDFAVHIRCFLRSSNR